MPQRWAGRIHARSEIRHTGHSSSNISVPFIVIASAGAVMRTTKRVEAGMTTRPSQRYGIWMFQASASRISGVPSAATVVLFLATVEAAVASAGTNGVGVTAAPPEPVVV